MEIQGIVGIKIYDSAKHPKMPFLVIRWNSVFLDS
jgi:hypothetical protein